MVVPISFLQYVPSLQAHTTQVKNAKFRGLMSNKRKEVLH
jgi:hypothetical protein